MTRERYSQQRTEYRRGGGSEVFLWKYWYICVVATPNILQGKEVSTYRYGISFSFTLRRLSVL